MVIRSGRPGDVDELLAFWRHAADGTSVSDDPIGVGRLLTHDPAAVLVAELDGVIIGTVVAGWDGWRGHIYRLAVAHDRFVVLSAVLADAMVEDDNLDAHATYEKTGYQKQEGRTRWLRDLHTRTDRTK